MPIKLPDRISAVASYIEMGASVADIGTDHGFLPVYLAQLASARRIIASDISAGSLAAARRNAEKYGVTEKITFITAPGLKGVDEESVDTVVITGMGGETIAGILEEAPWVSRPGVRLIAQPQTKAVFLCVWLCENGFIIRDSQIVRDRGRKYIIFMCQR